MLGELKKTYCNPHSIYTEYPVPLQLQPAYAGTAKNILYLIMSHQFSAKILGS